MFRHCLLYVKTGGHLAWHDLTEKISKEVQKFGIKDGVIHLQSLHTTATVLFVGAGDCESLSLALKNIAPREGRDYHHNDFNHRTVNMCEGECANGDSHCKAVWLPISCSLKVSEGELILEGKLPYLLEMDRKRPRKISLLVQEAGEPARKEEFSVSFPVSAGFRIIDVTDLITRQLKSSGLNQGVLTLTAPQGATLWVNENEPLLFEDFREMMNPRNRIEDYGLKFPDQIRLNVWKRQVQFGTWQRILLVERRQSQRREEIKIFFEGQ